MKRLAIIGSGELGQLIAHHAISQKLFTLVGFYDDWRQKDEVIFGSKILGGSHEIKSDYEQGVFDEIILAIGYKHIDVRKNLFENLQSKNIPFATLIHPSSYIESSCIIGKGVVVLPGCVLDKGVILEDNILLNTGCIIAHDTKVGKHCFLAPSIKLAGFIHIGECCFLGIGTTVIDNIKITNYVQTGGGTVVVKNITEKGLYVGVPHRKIEKI
jgi:sugar O-acyltransferase (sialic acid O-acetyltransferase NeuD family)